MFLSEEKENRTFQFSGEFRMYNHLDQLELFESAGWFFDSERRLL